MYKTAPLPTFDPGDTVSFCDQPAVVLDDLGSRVKVLYENGWNGSWYKVFEHFPVVLVKKAGE